MSGLRLEGFSGVVMEVDANRNLNVNLPVDAMQAGYVQLAGEVGNVNDPAGKVSRVARMSAQGRLAVGQAVQLFNEVFSYAAQNTALFTVPNSVMTAIFAGGYATLNANASVNANAYVILRTHQFFTCPSDLALYVEWDMMLTVVPQANCTIDCGWMQANTTVAATDGVYFRYDTTGVLKAVVNLNGTEVMSGALTVTNPGVANKYKIVVEADEVLFYINDALQANIPNSTTYVRPTYANSQPFMVRTYNAGLAPALGNPIKVGYVFVGLQDAGGLGRTQAHNSASVGGMSHQGQSGHTMGSTALFTNNLAPGAGVAMTNTTAALGSGLGGQFSALPTLAANTDGIVCSYQVPLPTANVPGKSLYITGVHVESVVSTALTGGPVVYVYSLAFGHTAVSLATAESVSTKAPRRIPLGVEAFDVSSAVGTNGSNNGVITQFTSPICVQPGEFVQVVAKNIGTVTTLGVISFIVMFDGYWV